MVQSGQSHGKRSTVWSVFDGSSTYFQPSTERFMVNYRVADLRSVLQALRSEGCDVDATVEEPDCGKFGWVMDQEGYRIEFWQPPAGQ
jgi:hypothetical protein